MTLAFYEICGQCLNRYATEYIGREEKIKPGEILCFGNKTEKTCEPKPHIALAMSEEHHKEFEAFYAFVNQFGYSYLTKKGLQRFKALKDEFVAILQQKHLEDIPLPQGCVSILDDGKPGETYGEYMQRVKEERTS